ncbi:hypothetical protein BUH_4310 [Burkholderia pseudomallei Pakistan 9]|nr:hypothetical protein BUH_4310 [Burkholderia pseudomallei Pakistan 9]
MLWERRKLEENNFPFCTSGGSYVSRIGSIHSSNFWTKCAEKFGKIDQ